MKVLSKTKELVNNSSSTSTNSDDTALNAFCDKAMAVWYEVQDEYLWDILFSTSFIKDWVEFRIVKSEKNDDDNYINYYLTRNGEKVNNYARPNKDWNPRKVFLLGELFTLLLAPFITRVPRTRS